MTSAELINEPPPHAVDDHDGAQEPVPDERASVVRALLWLERCWVEVAFTAFMVAFFVHLVDTMSGTWFLLDDWGLIEQSGSPDGFVRPYNDHLSLSILAVYRGLVEIFGFHYDAYRVVGLLCLVAIPLLYFFTTKRAWGPVVAAALALSMIGLPDNELYPALMNHWLVLIGAVICAAALNRGPRADPVLFGGLVLALSSAGGGVAVACACVVHHLCTRPPVRRWVVTLVPFSLWALWWVSFGQEPSRFRAAPGDSDAARSYALRILRAPFDHFSFGVQWVTGALIAGLVLYGVWSLRDGLRWGANFLAWTAALLVWAAGIAVGRPAFSTQVQPYDRYRFVALVLVLLALVPALVREQARSRQAPRALAAVGIVAALLAATMTWQAVDRDLAGISGNQVTRGWLARGDAILLAAGPSVIPDYVSPGQYLGLSAGDVRALFERYGSPFPMSVEGVDRALVDEGFARARVTEGAGPPQCEAMTGPIEGRERELTLWAEVPWKVEVRRFGSDWLLLKEAKAGRALALVLPMMSSRQPWQVRAEGACFVRGGRMRRSSHASLGTDRPLLAYFGHHKCATQWMRAIVADFCQVIGREQVVFNGVQDFGGDLGAALPDPASTFLCYMNADASHVARLGDLRGFHVVRDPRDVVVSAYYSHLYSHPLFGSLGERRAKLASLPEDDGLMMELEGRVHQFRAMLEWDYERPDILELRMEDLTSRADDGVPRIVEFLGLGAAEGLTPTRIQAVVEARDFAVLAKRPRGEEDVKSHYRKGVAGDWVDHFTEAHIAYFKEHYNELLVKLGYETGSDWG